MLLTVPKSFDFSQISSVPFYRVTFSYPISWVLLIDKPNESCKNSKKFEINPLSTIKKAFKKKRKKHCTSKDKRPSFINFFRTPKAYNSNLWNERQRTWNEVRATSRRNIKASLPVSADLSNDFKSIILETAQRKISLFMRLFWEEQQKYLQSSQNNATYHPMNPDTDVIYQTVNLFSSDKYFI